VRYGLLGLERRPFCIILDAGVAFQMGNWELGVRGVLEVGEKLFDVTPIRDRPFIDIAQR
jgi:hypothetical protein